MEEDIIQRKKNLIMFPLGTIGRDMVYNLVTSYLLTYVLFTRALTAAQLAAISAIMVGARVFDALNDPITGLVIDNIVHLTTKGVKSRDGFTAVCREKTETDVKTGTACRRFLLAIFVRQHKRRNE